jgi:hypothetical protein
VRVSLDELVAELRAQVQAQPDRAHAIVQEYRSIFLKLASDPANAQQVRDLRILASDMKDLVPPPVLVYEPDQIMQEVAETEGPPTGYHELAALEEQNALHASHRTSHHRNVNPRSFLVCRLGDQATVKFNPSPEDMAQGIKASAPVGFYVGTKPEAMALTVDLSIVGAPTLTEANPPGGPKQSCRPYCDLQYGVDGFKTQGIRVDPGQRLTVVADFVSVAVGMRAPRAGDVSGVMSLGCMIGAFSGRTAAPVLYTEYIDGLQSPPGTPTTGTVPRPAKANLLLSPQMSDVSGTAATSLDFLDSAGDRIYGTPSFAPGAGNWPIALTADVFYVRVNYLGASSSDYRLPFQLTL